MEKVEIIRKTKERNGRKYTLLLIPNEERSNFTDIYIQSGRKGLMTFCIGLDFKELSCSMDDFIEDNLEEWIEDCENDIELLEKATEEQMIKKGKHDTV